MAGILYVVATPIGNLDDITVRAVKTLKEADLIAAEDTRHTKKLLIHLAIATPATSYHEHNEEQKSEELISKLRDGKNIALVTDAGTPCVSDPGYRLVKKASMAGIKVVPIPGASAMTAALSASGLPSDEFTFKGFLPEKQGARRKVLTEMALREATYILYESPKRTVKLLKDIEEIMGDVNIVVARELTKVYEEFIRGTVSEVLSRISGDLKGEVTVILRTGSPVSADYEEALLSLIKEGASVRDAVDIISSDYGVSKKEVYDKAVILKNS